MKCIQDTGYKEPKKYCIQGDIRSKKANNNYRGACDGRQKGGAEINEIITIQNIPCYEKNGVAYLNLEAVARGLGFTTVATSGNEVVRWNTVYGYLKALNAVATSCNDTEAPNYRALCPDFIPENIFYRLAMKAKNETAEAFQALIADEVIPAIRKHGAYMTPDAIERVLTDPDTIIRLAQDLKDERTLRLRLQEKNSELAVQTQILKPKAEYFDEIVDRNLLTNFRETAKQLHIGERAFVNFLVEHKYIYRDKSGKLLPTAEKNNGLFEVKECVNEKSGWSGTQTLLTPKGRETFRLLCQGLVA